MDVSAKSYPRGGRARTGSHAVDGEVGFQNGRIQGALAFSHWDWVDELACEKTRQNRETWARAGKGVSAAETPPTHPWACDSSDKESGKENTADMRRCKTSREISSGSRRPLTT